MKVLWHNRQATRLSSASARAARRWRWCRRARCRAGSPRRLVSKPERIEIKVIRTTGDVVQDRPLADAGGKGLFAKEIEEALLAGAIDLAVHSSKDLPTVLPPGLVLAGFLPREDPRDAFISRKAKTLRELPPGAVVGTASPRRQALVKRLRPDISVVSLRGNVETRLRKLEAGEVDATLLAVAGLKRLGLLSAATAILDPDEFLPAVGQGAIGIETRADDARTRALVATIDDADTATALAAERAFLAVLDGSCRTPIGGHAAISGGTLRFRGIIVKPDGSEAFEVLREGRRDAGGGARRRRRPRIARRAGADFFVRDLSVRLLVTRPNADAERTAATLRARGHDVSSRPLLRIEPVADARDWRRAVGGDSGHQRQCGGDRRPQALLAITRAAGVRGRRAQRAGDARGRLCRCDVGRRRRRRSHASLSPSASSEGVAPLSRRR